MSDRGLRLSAFAATDRGRVREANEDSYYLGHTVFAVADGMGGHVAGEVASRKALEPIADLDGQQFPAPEAAQDALVDAVTAANTAVVEKGDADPQLQGMGTTLTTVLVRDGRLHLAHVGDSRAYLLRHGEPISQLTTDHTLVEQLVREGRLSREQAARHPQRSVITRAIGVEREVKVDSLPPIELQPGDQVLLCSDGLTGPVDDDRITTLLDGYADDPGDAVCRALVEAANDAGGPDNITVVLLRVARAPRNSPAGMTAARPPAHDTPADTAPLETGAAPPGGGSAQLGNAAAGARGSDGRATSTGAGQRPPADGDADRGGSREKPAAKQIRTRDERWSEDWAERMGRLGKPQGAEGTGLGRRSRRGGRAAGIAAVAVGAFLLLALLVGGGYGLLSRAYFVGDADGEIAIYNGIPQTIAGLRLHWVRENTGLATDDLPPFRAAQVRDGVTAASLVQAREVVERYRQMVDDSDASPTDTGTTGGDTGGDTGTTDPGTTTRTRAPTAGPSPSPGVGASP